jgi:hypothetical protein
MKGIGRVGRILADNKVLVLGCIACFALPALAESDPNACRGIDFDMKRPLVASRISVRSHMNFVKGSDHDAACPADKDACSQKSVPRSRGRSFDGPGARRLHLCLVSILAYAKTELDGRLAADRIPDSTATNGLAEGR